MKLRMSSALIGMGFIVWITPAQENIPRGTIIPVSLNSSLSSQKSKTGQRISAWVSQDVPLPQGMKIKEAARITGHVVDVITATQGAEAHISLVFDRAVASGKTLPVTTNLRAIASAVEVESAQIPTMGMGCGDTWDSRTTVQIGGDVVYWGGGPVDSSSGPVGKPVTGSTAGVLVRPTAKPGSPCEGDIDEDQGPQALWVFSSDACGVYGLDDTMIAHARAECFSG